jgi:hypothetical protein
MNVDADAKKDERKIHCSRIGIADLGTSIPKGIQDQRTCDGFLLPILSMLIELSVA